MSKKDFVLDVHTHTIASGHAYNTIDEMITEAKKKNLKLLGISDHCFDMPGSSHSYYFSNFNVLKKVKQSKELEVLFGCEANIIETEKGYTLDILKDEFCTNCMDYIIASFHKICFSPKSKEENTKALLDVIKTNKVNILGHLDDGNFDLDYETIIKTAKEYNVIVELNNSSNSPNSFRSNSYELDLIILGLCKKYEVPIILNSDAHTKEDILNFKYILPILKEVDFPKKLIINTSVKKFKKYCIDKNW